ncbi:MAG: SagB/ThcOx family dehydrogenase [Candidatus Heimdallarchaeota archaeon]|nr:SagB/ThcOx family dehydrogenase [Candidatus Heimdallarchaeota archaeon]
MKNNIGKEFMKKTQYSYVTPSDQSQGLPTPHFEIEYAHKMKSFDLPKPATLDYDRCTLKSAIEDRRSVRKYSDKKMTLKELSWLLWSTQGIREYVQETITLRNVPSAGARHALETYLLINNVENLEQGLYRYIASEHKLVEYVFDENIPDVIVKAALNQKFLKNNSVTFIWTAVPYRMVYRYSERSYRYLHIDVGHVCQNLYLAAEAIQAGVCAVAAFDDNLLNDALRIDGNEQFAIYLASVGKKKKDEEDDK